jgi:hypothetical protein
LTKIKQGIDHNQISYHLKIYILGGITGNASIAESDAGNSFLIDLGIDSNKIFLENFNDNFTYIGQCVFEVILCGAT